MKDEKLGFGPVTFHGVMDNGTHEFHHRDKNGQEIRVYGRFVDTPGSWVQSPTPPAPKKELPTPPAPKKELPKLGMDPGQIREVPVSAVKTDTQRTFLDTFMVPMTFYIAPGEEKKALLRERGRYMQTLFGKWYPEGSLPAGTAWRFRVERMADGTVLVIPPEDFEGSDYWCRAYILLGDGPEDFMFFTLEETPMGPVIGLIDRDLRHFHLKKGCPDPKEAALLARDLYRKGAPENELL